MLKPMPLKAIWVITNKINIATLPTVCPYKPHIKQRKDRKYCKFILETFAKGDRY